MPPPSKRWLATRVPAAGVGPPPSPGEPPLIARGGGPLRGRREVAQRALPGLVAAVAAAARFGECRSRRASGAAAREGRGGHLSRGRWLGPGGAPCRLRKQQPRGAGAALIARC